MDRPFLGKDLLSRSLRISWVLALALTALLLPSRPSVALAIAAGQLIASSNFVFLRTLVKLFTEKRSAGVPQGRILFIVFAKFLFVYGGAFALIRVAGVAFAPFSIGLGLPLLTLFLKSTIANVAKPAAFILLTLVALTAPTLCLAAEHAAAAHAEEGGSELPNWLVILHDWVHGNPVVDWLNANQILAFAWIGGLAFLAFSWFAMRKPKMVPGQLQNGLEWIIESMEDICGGMLGKHLDRYFPFIGAVFFYILTINLIGIFPGMKSSTSSLDLTLALALIVFLYVQFSGIKNLGLLGYLDHLAGSPRDAIGFAMLPVMIPVHVLGELVKPVSLSCRLFGNIFGEDTLIVVFVGVAAMCLKASLTLLAVPPLMGITALFMLLQTLTSIVQALIFSLLTTVYLYMMLPHEEHAHGETEHAH